MNQPYQIASGIVRCISTKTSSRIGGVLTGGIAGLILLLDRKVSLRLPTNLRFRLEIEVLEQSLFSCFEEMILPLATVNEMKFVVTKAASPQLSRKDFGERLFRAECFGNGKPAVLLANEISWI